MSHSTKAPTKAQRQKLEMVAAMRCLCCEFEGADQPFRTEIDHLVDKGSRKHSGGHDSILPICSYHHRGVCIEGVNAAEMACAFGPSFALEGRKAIARYGRKRELQAIVSMTLEAKGESID